MGVCSHHKGCTYNTDMQHSIHSSASNQITTQRRASEAEAPLTTTQYAEKELNKLKAEGIRMERENKVAQDQKEAAT